MPQFNLSQTSGEELRRLYETSRQRGDTALEDAVVRELRARDARPPEPRNFPPQPDRGERDDTPPGAATAPRTWGFVPADYTRGDRDRDIGGPRQDRPLPTGNPRPPVSAKLALFAALALAVGAAGGWLAHERAGRRGAAGSDAMAVATKPSAARTLSSDRLDGAGTQPPIADADGAGRSSPATDGAEPAAAPERRGIVIIRSPPAPAASTTAAPTRPRVSERLPPPPRALAPAPTRQDLVPAQQGGPVRVFIHVAGQGQGQDVDRIRSQLRGLSFGGQPVAVPPVRLVQSTPGRMEIRCLKRADCAAGSRIAHQLTQDLRTPVALVDMSRTYEHDGAVRPGSLELWVPSL